MCQRANAQKNDENHGEPAMLGPIDAGCPASRRRQPSVPEEAFQTGTPERRENYQDGHPVAQDQRQVRQELKPENRELAERKGNHGYARNDENANAAKRQVPPELPGAVV
jgi:hypothetical protein